MFSIIPSDASFEGCSLITGFHGIGMTGYWAVKHLIQKLDIGRVAFIDSDTMSPVASTSHGRLVTPYELFQKEKLVILKVETPPSRGREVEFFREFSEWVISKRFREVALIGGLDSGLRSDASEFRFVHTHEFNPSGVLASAEKLEDDRIIVGPVAILLNYFEMKGFPAFAILTYASTERVDPRAAAIAIRVLSDYFGYEVDVSSLIRGAEVLESEIAKEQGKVGRSESIYT